MKKYLFLHSHLTEYYLASLNHLAKSDIEVHLFYLPKSDYQINTNNLPQNLFLYNRTLFNSNELLSEVNNIQPTKIFCSGWRDFSYLKICKSYIHKIPTVLMMDNKWYPTLKQRIASLFGPVVLPVYFSHIWIAGEPQLKYAQKLGFKKQYVKQGCLSADTELFHQYYKERPKKDVAVPKRLLFIGRYVDEKNLVFLFDTFISVINHGYSDWELHCVGSGKLENELPIHSNIIHHGYISSHQLKEIVCSSRAFILASKKEAWGVVIHEMISAGLPIICSSEVGAASQFVEHGKNGFIFESNNNSELEKYLKMIMEMEGNQLKVMGSLSYNKSLQWSPDDWVKVALEIEIN